jgi:hypothetical protein
VLQEACGPTSLLKLSTGQRGSLIPSELLHIDDADAAAADAASFTSQCDICLLLHVCASWTLDTSN